MDELRSALELATEEELQALTDILFRPKFNPLDYFHTPDPVAMQSGTRQQWIDRVEQRFRFLAADGLTVLNGQSQQITYRQALIQICRFLKLPYREAWPTADIEAEVFLHLLEKTWSQLSQGERDRLQRQLQQSLAQSPQFQTLPLPLQNNPMALLAKGGGAVAISSVLRPWLLHHIARQIALNVARYEVAKQALVKGGGTAVAQIQSRFALGMASRGVAVNAARYGATRTVLSFLGPALWTWFLADLGWRAVATNHGRVIPVVFALAQIRLTRAPDYPELATG
ncbi:MAG: YaaW family protein [Nodosilinea sp.]